MHFRHGDNPREERDSWTNVVLLGVHFWNLSGFGGGDSSCFHEGMWVRRTWPWKSGKCTVSLAQTKNGCHFLWHRRHSSPELHFLSVERTRRCPDQRHKEASPSTGCLLGRVPSLPAHGPLRAVSGASQNLGQSGQTEARLLCDTVGKLTLPLAHQVAICSSQCNFYENLLFRKPVSSLL